MVNQDKRRAPRYKTEPIPVVLRSESLPENEGSLVDVSTSGAFLRDCCCPEDTAEITLRPQRKCPIAKTVRLTRRDEEGKKWVAVQFDNSLSEAEVLGLAGQKPRQLPVGSRDQYDFAKQDRVEIIRETRDIKSCRSSIFLWTMGLLISACVTIWTLAIEQKVTVITTLPVMVVMLIVFFLGSLSVLEKARAINMREGFVAALDYYLSRNEGPIGYRGWGQIKNCLVECGARRRLKICPRGTGPQDTTGCRDEGEAMAAPLASAKRVIPSLIDSFTSFVGTVYGMTFVILLVLFCLSLSITWRDTQQISVWSTVSTFVVGLMSSSVLWRFRKLVIGIVVGVVLAVVLGTVLSEWLLNLCASYGLGALLGAMAWFLARQLRAARVGRFSFDTYLYSWLLVMENCVCLPEASTNRAMYEAPTAFRRYQASLVNWILNCPSHRDIVDEFERSPRPT